MMTSSATEGCHTRRSVTELVFGHGGGEVNNGLTTYPIRCNKAVAGSKPAIWEDQRKQRESQPTKSSLSIILQGSCWLWLPYRLSPVLTAPVSAVPALFATVRAPPGPFRPVKTAPSGAVTAAGYRLSFT